MSHITPDKAAEKLDEVSVMLSFRVKRRPGVDPIFVPADGMIMADDRDYDALERLVNEHVAPAIERAQEVKQPLPAARKTGPVAALAAGPALPPAHQSPPPCAMLLGRSL